MGLIRKGKHPINTRKLKYEAETLNAERDA